MGNVEKWLAIISVALFAMFAGEMISVYYFMLTVPEDAVVAQGFTPDPKLIQFVSIGVAPAGILAAVAYIMSRNYGSKQIGGLIIVGGIILPSTKSKPSVASSFLKISTHICGGKYSINAQFDVLKAKLAVAEIDTEVFQQWGTIILLLS